MIARKKSVPLLAVAVATVASGCFGTQNQAQVTNGAGDRTQPVVEAFVEYAGPNERWAGPQTFLIHVTAREEGLPRIDALPEAFGDWAHFMRAPASSDVARKVADHAGQQVEHAKAAPAEKHYSAIALTAAEARERLSGLAQALEQPAPDFHGCATPVRVRLVRADGSVVEKQGCRAATGWPRAAGETVQWAMSVATTDDYRAAYVAAYAQAPRKPASVTVPVAGH